MHGDGRILAVLVARPDVLGRLVGAVFNFRDVAHEHRFALARFAAYGDNQLTDIGRRFEIGAGLHQDLGIAGNEAARRLQRVAQLQRTGQILRRDAEGVHALAVHDDTNHMIRPADRRNVTCTLDALEFNLGRPRHLLQLEGRAFRVRRAESQRDDRHVVDALGLDDRLHHPEIGRQPVAIRVHGVVEADDRVVVLDADRELHGDDRHARPRYREDVLEPRQAREHLLARACHQILDVLRRRPRERDEDAGHGHVDLRLFLARRDQGGENAHQQGDQGQQRRHLRRLEGLGDTTGNTETHSAPRFIRFISCPSTS